MAGCLTPTGEELVLLTFLLGMNQTVCVVCASEGPKATNERAGDEALDGFCDFVMVAGSLSGTVAGSLVGTSPRSPGYARTFR